VSEARKRGLQAGRLSGGAHLTFDTGRLTFPRVSVIRRSRTILLYALALLYEFRWSFFIFLTFLVVGAVAFYATPEEFGRPEQRTVLNCVYASWMAMLAQPVNAMPSTALLVVVCGLYPLIGLMVLGEGVVRLALLLFSKRHGRKEWMRVMASTYRDHVVLCGIGHLGVRVLEELASAKAPVVAIERDETGPFVAQAKATGTPVIIGDMKQDATLIAAGVGRARVVIIATNDDMANLEVALDSRRLNPEIRVVMRLFEQSIAEKISNAFLVDWAFSASTLAAPIVASMSLGTKVLSSSLIAGIPHVSAEFAVDEGSGLAGRTIDQVEREYCCNILARMPANDPIQLPPDNHVVVCARDTLVVHTPSSQLATIAAAARGAVGAGV
jgi:Trk K+ transport system NAD-binding subunit